MSPMWRDYDGARPELTTETDDDGTDDDTTETDTTTDDEPTGGSA